MCIVNRDRFFAGQVSCWTSMLLDMYERCNRSFTGNHGYMHGAHGQCETLPEVTDELSVGYVITADCVPNRKKSDTSRASSAYV